MYKGNSMHDYQAGMPFEQMAEKADTYDKAQRLAELNNCTGANDLIIQIGTDSIVPGICMNPGCDNAVDVEPDCANGYCDLCHTESVDSIYIILGII